MNYYYYYYKCMEKKKKRFEFLFFYSDLRTWLRREKRNVHDSRNLPVSIYIFISVNLLYKYESISLLIPFFFPFYYIYIYFFYFESVIKSLRLVHGHPYLTTLTPAPLPHNRSSSYTHSCCLFMDWSCYGYLSDSISAENIILNVISSRSYLLLLSSRNDSS